MAAAIVAMVGGIVAVGRLSTGGPGGGPAGGEQPVPAAVLAAVTAPTPDVLAAVGDGGVANPLKPVPSTPRNLDAAGKPIVLYIGADFCPYCAAERWSLILALSRFGTFSGLRLMTSSGTDIDPNTATFTFADSTYTSPYLDFQAVETETRDQLPLQTPNAEQARAFAAYDVPPYSPSAGGIPFIDIADQAVAISSGYDPSLLQGLDWNQIAAQLSAPATAQTRAIEGNANWLTAGICSVIANQPSSVCAAAPIPEMEGRLTASAQP